MRPEEAVGLVAVVTGASSGIGRRLAADLDRLGTAVTAVARREEELADLADGFRVEGSGYRSCDVADVDSYRSLLAEVEAAQGRIDLLVQSAGAERRVPALEADLDLYRRLFAVNFFATVAGTLQVLDGMVQRGRGYVLNVSSDHGRAPGPDSAAYCASKAAVSAFTESVAHEVRDRGVHLHVLYPGWVPTRLGLGAVEHGMPQPPRMVQRSVEEVSRAAIRSLGGSSIDINVAPLAKFAPVAKALAPALYRRSMERQG